MAKKLQSPNEAIQTKNLPTSSKKAVHKIVGEMGPNIKSVIAAKSESLKSQAATAQEKSELASTPAESEKALGNAQSLTARARRMDVLGAAVKPSKLTVQKSANNVEELFRAGAVNLSAAKDDAGMTRRMWKIDSKTGEIDKNPGLSGKPILAGTKMPGEILAGVGFYHQTHAEAAEANPENPEVAFGATAAASSRARIEDEKSAVDEVFRSHRNGATVFMHPAIYQHLSSVGAAPSADTIGTHVKVSALPAQSVAELANSNIAPLVKTHSRGVDFTQIGKATNMATRLKVIQIARGEIDAANSQDPLTAPKTWSFKENKRTATPDTEGEYMMRAQHISDVLNGRESAGQQMFDFYGMRNSNEGILSNEGHTTEDSWQKSIHMGHLVPEEFPDKKALGELEPRRATATVDGKRVSVFPKAGTSAVMHAYGNEATTLAAKQLQSKMGLDYTVPAAMVQEVAWASARRKDYAESSKEYKEHQDSLIKSSKSDDQMRISEAKQAKSEASSLRSPGATNAKFNARAIAKQNGLGPKQDGMLF